MSDARQKEVLACEEARRNAMLQSDVAALNRLVSDALTYTHSSGGKDSKASWLGKITDGSIRYDKLAFNDLKVTVVNDTAVINGHMSATVVHSGQPRAVESLYLAVWVRQASGWQMVAGQGTPMPAK